jgi:anti-anti-sigma factor
MAEHWLVLPEEFDIAAVAEMRVELMAAVARGHELVIDCSVLRFIDSTGVAVLLEANRALEADARRLVLVNVTDQPRQLLEWLGLTDLIGGDREIST